MQRGAHDDCALDPPDGMRDEARQRISAHLNEDVVRWRRHVRAQEWLEVDVVGEPVRVLGAHL